MVLTIDIGKAPLYVGVAQTYTREQGAPNPTFQFNFPVSTPNTTGGFQFSDTDIPSVVSGVPNLITTADQSSPPGNYTIVVSQGTLFAANYYFVFQPGTLIVTPPGYVTITASPSSLTIPTGLSAQTTLTLTPTQTIQGFTTLYQGTMTLSCGQVPTNVSCIISPSTYNFPGNQNIGQGLTPGENPAQGTVTITASGTTVVGSVRGGNSITQAAGFLIPAAFAGLMLAFARRRAARRTGVWGMLMLLALGAGMLVISSCGGSSKMSTAAPGATTFMITGSGTDISGNTVTATLPLSVTIQ